MDHCDIIFILAEVPKPSAFGVSFISGDVRIAGFKVKASEGGRSWTEIFDGYSRERTSELEAHFLEKPVKARYVKFTIKRPGRHIAM